MNNIIITEINEKVVKNTIQRCRERNIIIPTFAEQKNPDLIPESITEKLKDTGVWDVNPLNLFRITWKNEPKTRGGLFNQGNWLEFPSAFTGVKARIIGVVGKWFPTGSHKVGPGFSCLVPRLVSGTFDPTTQKAVWPSTGNYCRGGAFDCALLAAPAIAILPEEMSQERFDWLRDIGTDEIFATPGSESNVKEIYDKCWELRKERGDDVVIFNQFDEFANYLWHFHITGNVCEDIFNQIKTDNSRLSAFVSATGSAGTIAAGDYLKNLEPGLRIVATEALQCPTLLQFGFGAHRIEGIGDKHIPWVHNVRNTDMVVAVDDEQTMRLLRLFNEPEGLAVLNEMGADAAFTDQLDLLGISSICNLISSIKTARYYDMDERDIIFTPLTDSVEMYGSRLAEMSEIHGSYSREHAFRDSARFIDGITIDNMRELNYQDRKALHNFKYFTWVEQQGKDVEELRELWEPEFWEGLWPQVEEWDELIREFNRQTGL